LRATFRPGLIAIWDDLLFLFFLDDRRRVTFRNRFQKALHPKRRLQSHGRNTFM
jgi:hypothetical protein